MNATQHYRGYAVHAFAHPLRDKTFSADLLLERDSGSHPESDDDAQYRFYSLDYFSNETDAVEYSRRYAREWIDTRG